MNEEKSAEMICKKKIYKYSNKSITKITIIISVIDINNNNENFKQTNLPFEQGHDYKTFKHLNIIPKAFYFKCF